VLNKFPVSVLTCTSHPLTVAQSYPLAHLVSTCHSLPALSGAKEVGTLPQSFISFPVAQSNTAKCQSVLLAGQLTSQLPVQDSPLGIQKFNIAALEVPTLVTVAELHGDSVVVVPTVIVAASQSAPSAPSAQSAQGVQGSHCTPCGIVKFNTAADDVPVLVIATLVPAAHVVTVPTVIVPAGHCGQVGHSGHCGQVAPVAPVAPVSPLSHLSPFRLEYCAFLILLPSSESLNRM
jgi:hypothetical protein